MKKEGFVFGLLALSFVFLTGLVSAQFYGGTLFQNFLNYLDPLMLVFLIFFGLIFFALSKSIFRYNSGLAGIIAGAASLLIIYFTDRYGYDYQSLFSNIFFFIPEDIIYTFLPLVIFLVVGLLWWKFGFGPTLTVVGGFFIFAAFFVYEGLTTGIIGIILAVVGGILWMRRRSPGFGSGVGDKYRRTMDYLDTRQQRKLEGEQERYHREQAERDAKKRREELRRDEMQRQAEEKRKAVENLKRLAKDTKDYKGWFK